MSNNFILGAGIAGLLCAHYLQDFQIIGKSTEAQEKASFPCGPRFLNFSNQTLELLNELDLPVKTKKIKIGYFYKGALYANLTPEMRAEYFAKTRGHSQVTNSSMSGGQNELEVFAVSPDKLYAELLKRAKDRIIDRKVGLIEYHTKQLFFGDLVYGVAYDKIVNTIPAPAFFKLIGKNIYNFKSARKCFLLCSRIADMDMGNFDYCYFPEIDNPITRITKFGRQFVIESAQNENLGVKAHIQDIKIIENSQIVNSQNIESFGDIRFVGRYARWNHALKIEDVIDEAKKIKEEKPCQCL